MAGTLLNKKNKISRFQHDKNRLHYIFINSICNNYYLPKTISLTFLVKTNLLKVSSISVIKNKCLISNRNRSVLKLFRLTRMRLKYLAVNGNINGIKKSSW